MTWVGFIALVALAVILIGMLRRIEKLEDRFRRGDHE